MDGASDEDLMARISRGDERAFRLLARRYLPRALGLARRVLGNEADAEEIVQEALLRVWVNAARWRPTAAFRTWFYRVVLNLCLNRKRRAPFAALADIDEPADPGPGPFLEIEHRQTDRLVAGAVAALPDRAPAVIARHCERSGERSEEAMRRVLARLAAPLPPQRRSLVTRLLPAALLEFDLAPAWPRFAALVAIMVLGFAVGLSDTGMALNKHSASTTISTSTGADSDLSLMLFEPDPLSAMR